MELFLTSSPCDNHVPDGLNIPCIFAKENGFAAAISALVHPGMRLTVIAATPDAHELNDEMLSTFHNCFLQLGLSPMPSVLIDDRNLKIVPEILKTSDVILLSGGHVPTQHAFFKKIRLREQLRGFKGVVIGISAGSMNCAETVYAIPEENGEAKDPNYERFIRGLGLTGVMIIPHYNRLREMHVDGLRVIEDLAVPDSRGRSFCVLPDFSYVRVSPGQPPRVFGEAYLISDGCIRKLCENDESISIN